MTLPDLETSVWPAKGIAPAQTGDMVYSAGEQPIAPYDNRAMWNVTTDIHALRDTLGSHVDRHQTGGDDELDLQNLRVNGIAAINADTDSSEVRWVDPAESTSVSRLDIANGVWRQSPDFVDDPTFQSGFSLTDHIDDTGGTLLYDNAAGETGKFHYAKQADHALEADWADVAGALEDDNGNQYEPGDFLTAEQDATITGSWSYDQTISGDIDGNAATADHADEAGHATTAGHADTSDESDTVDGYHAQDLIDQAQQSSEWQHIETAAHSTVGEQFEWQVQSGTTYDMYKLTIYHEMHGRGGHFHLRFGEGGSVDSRWDYVFVGKDLKGDGTAEWDETTSTNFWPGQADANSTSTSEHIITCPAAENAPDRKYPHIGTGFDAQNSFRGSFLHHGALERVYDAIDTFHIWSKTDQSTGRIVLKGMNIT